MNLKLDPQFKPAIIELNNFKNEVKKLKKKNHLVIALRRGTNEVYHYQLDVYLDGVNDKRNFFIVERLVKTLLWVIGGYEVIIYGSKRIYEHLKKEYSKNHNRAFDCKFMSTCFEKEFKVTYVSNLKKMPKESIKYHQVNTVLKGKRLGFDAGGSDIKISAVKNGKVVYAKEIVWLPKLNSDIKYHQDVAYKAFKEGIKHLGGDVDAIGVSSAGVIINNRPMQCSLFIKAINKHFKEVKNFYIDLIKRLEKEVHHPIPFEVANDGDVSAIAGMLDKKEGALMGLAMGTSEAVGYINKDKCITGQFNELAFAPVDFNPNAMVDEWSGDYGVGCKYLSQDAVIKLAKAAKIKINPKLTLAEQLKYVQALHEKGDKRAIEIFKTIGDYLAYALAYYSEFYEIRHVLLLGRVTSGKGGNVIIKEAKIRLKQEFPKLKINLFMPTEYIRRVGQAIAAASLGNKK